MSISSIVYILSNKSETFCRTVIESLNLEMLIFELKHGNVGEQLWKIYPGGSLSTKNIKLLIKLTERLLKSTPKVQKYRYLTFKI